MPSSSETGNGYPVPGNHAMPQPQDAPRPQSVTVIGWLWLVLGVLAFFRTLINIAVWRVLKPDLPTLLQAFGDVPAPQQRFVRPLLEHMPAFHAAEAIASVAVIVVAIQFLRRRPWARAGMQAVCWFFLFWVAAFGVFWVWLCRSAAATDPSYSTSAFGKFGLPAGLAACAAAAAGLAAMIVLLAGQRVRDAFPGASGSAEG